MAGSAKEYSLVFMLRAQLDASMQQFSTVGRQIKELEEQVQKYNKTLSDIEAYRKQSKYLSEMEAKLQEAAEQQREASRAHSEAINRHNAAKEAVQKHEAEIERLNSAIAEEKLRIKEEVADLRAGKAGQDAINKAKQESTHRIAELERQLQRETAEQKRSEAALKETDEAQRKATQAMNSAQHAHDRLKEKTAQERDVLKQMDEALRAAKVDTDDLAKSEERLKEEAEQTNEKLERLAAFENGVNALADRFNSLAAAANEANKVLEPLMGFFVDSTRTAGNLEYAVSAVRAVSGATQEETARMTEAVREMGRTTVYTAEEAAGAMQNMALAGWDPKQMIAGLPAVVKLAAASGEEIAQVTGIVSDGMNAFQLTGEQAAVKFADVLAKAATSSNTNVGLLGESLSYVETTAGNLGYTIEDVSVALAAMANNALKGGVSGSALNTMLTRMSGANEVAAAEMERLGLSMYGANGQAKPLLQFLGELRTRFREFSGNAQEAQISAYKLAGQRGMRGLLALVNQTDEQFQALTEDVYNFSGAADQISDIRLENFNGKLKLMEDAWTDLKVTIGNEFIPTASDAVELLTDLTNGANEFAENHGGVVRGIAATGGVLWGVANAAIAAAPAVAALKYALLGLGASTLLPVLATVGVGAGLIGAGVALYGSKAHQATLEGTRFRRELDEEIGTEQELIEKNRELLDAMNEGDEKYATRGNLIDQYIEDAKKLREAADDAIQKRDEFIQKLKDSGHYGTRLDSITGQVTIDYGVMTSTERGSLDAYQKAAEEAEGAAAGLESEIERLKAEQEAQTHAAMDELGVNEELFDVFARTESAAGNLAEAYAKIYQEVEKAYDKQFAMFELVEEKQAELDELGKALDSQADYWNEYAANLDALKEAANGADIDLSGMWAYLTSGSTDAAAAVAAMTDSIREGDTSELEALVGKYDAMIEARTKATEYATEGFDEIQKKWAEVRKQIEDNVEGSEAYDAAYAAMGETFRGFLDGVDIGSSRVDTALAAAARRWKGTLTGTSTESRSRLMVSSTLYPDGQYASGTDSARRGIALVGERGPELVYMNGGEKVIPADRTREMLYRAVAERERAERNSVIELPRIAASESGGRGGPLEVTVKIEVSDNATPDTVHALFQHRDVIEGIVKRTIRDQGIDARRRAFA